MRQNKQPKNSEINHCKKRKQEGANWLRTNSSLYKDEGIIFEAIGSISTVTL